MSAAGAARLVWERPDGEKVEFALDRDAMVVGREEVDILVDEPLVSRQHARLEKRDDGWFVIDLGSTNLTRVNDNVVRECLLADGDEVRFSRARCRFFADSAAADSPGK